MGREERENERREAEGSVRGDVPPEKAQECEGLVGAYPEVLN